MSTVLGEQLVAAPTVAAMYLSRRSDLRLVRIPRYPQHSAAGVKVGETRGQAFQFRSGQLVIQKDGPLVTDNGTKIEDEEEKEAVVRWLDAHPLIGDVEEGFWRIDPAAPPVSADELKRLTRLSIQLDEAGIRRMLEQERAGWNRDQLVEAASDALEQVRAQREELEAQIAAQQQEEEAAKAQQAAAPKAKPTRG